MNTPRFYDGPVDGARLADALLKIDRDILRYRAGRAAEADAETQRREGRPGGGSAAPLQPGRSLTTP